MDPDNPEYHEKLGVYLAKAYEEDEAINHLTKAIELNPNAKDAYFYRGIVHKSRNEFSEALANFNKVIDLKSTSGNTFLEDAQQKINELKTLEAMKHFRDLKAKQHDPLESRGVHTRSNPLQNYNGEAIWTLMRPSR